MHVVFEGQIKEWTANPPVTKFGYTAHRETIRTRDDYFTDIKIYLPSTLVTPTANLRLLFVIYGGGWTIGNHHAEEMLLLRPSMQNFDFCIISVNYRLAPEPFFPSPLDDYCDALNWAVDLAERFSFDAECVLLAGSSSGANLAAALSHMARDTGSPNISELSLNILIVGHP
ncbi:MAG: hypothetical protein ALECFALPRED_008940 [Alectoria fallacina]|uniref:Alpha/beta hydrolase fold-3 domain-containing protein n=1 Tax=Alectoria fallacina TaxID=1903189 RepID=A0A8H3EXM3_9LECA|nr:MAG: hypothetical protein ALECFALPRED_008940 [Alectoria fallacina]